MQTAMVSLDSTLGGKCLKCEISETTFDILQPPLRSRLPSMKMPTRPRSHTESHFNLASRGFSKTLLMPGILKR
ncbi:hypothetical protein DOTSEDRAFT_68490 [Dothistroma septosporum NZE10]|uniref:Uncharacterized protein n=1 Tax=Dothistroma septosporum (strain NZE10 / CBS 128990) TaxID=675120 RepID=N1Q4U5_DOTSN|nr:hypothetical protein DOTSEDRAFT_68490 [Dothistroma septosporum NZE10]